MLSKRRRSEFCPVDREKSGILGPKKRQNPPDSGADRRGKHLINTGRTKKGVSLGDLFEIENISQTKKRSRSNLRDIIKRT